MGYGNNGWIEILERSREPVSIITTAANPLMEQIHNTKKRMPLIKDHEAAMRWVSSDIKKDEIEHDSTSHTGMIIHHARFHVALKNQIINT